MVLLILTEMFKILNALLCWWINMLFFFSLEMKNTVWI